MESTTISTQTQTHTSDSIRLASATRQSGLSMLLGSRRNDDVLRFTLGERLAVGGLTRAAKAA